MVNPCSRRLAFWCFHFTFLLFLSSLLLWYLFSLFLSNTYHSLPNLARLMVSADHITPRPIGVPWAATRQDKTRLPTRKPQLFEGLLWLKLSLEYLTWNNRFFLPDIRSITKSTNLAAAILTKHSTICEQKHQKTFSSEMSFDGWWGSVIVIFWGRAASY